MRVPDVGHELFALEHRQWIRRLRRACPRISTNEYADSACPMHEYVATRAATATATAAAARRASIQRRDSQRAGDTDHLAGLGDFLAKNQW